MPKTREQKEEIVSLMSEKLSRIKSAVFTSVSGYTMEDANMLRSKGHDAGVELAITKKTLLVRALEQNGFTFSQNELEGSVLSALGYEDEIAPAKLMADFTKGRDEIRIVGGILEGRIVDADSVKQLASLPSREELLAKLVGSINAPVSGFVNVLAGNLRGLVCALNAIKEAKA